MKPQFEIGQGVMHMNTVILADGYNGHTARFYTEPLDVEDNLVKLRCAEPGKEYMFRWVSKIEVVAAWDRAQLLSKWYV